MQRVITPEDFEHVCQFAAEIFCTHEPLMKSLSPTVPEVVQLFSPIIEASCCSGLSFMLEEQTAAGTGTGTIMSLSLALPYTQYTAVPWPAVSFARPALTIMDSLPELPAEQAAAAVYGFLWGTHCDHTGKGYMKRVLNATIQAALRAGYSYLAADVTNVVSQGLAISHFGFQPLEPKARYHDYDCFKGVQGTEFVMRVVKDLAAEPAAAEVPAQQA